MAEQQRRGALCPVGLACYVSLMESQKQRLQFARHACSLAGLTAGTATFGLGVLAALVLQRHGLGLWLTAAGPLLLASSALSDTIAPSEPSARRRVVVRRAALLVAGCLILGMAVVFVGVLRGGLPNNGARFDIIGAAIAAAAALSMMLGLLAPRSEIAYLTALAVLAVLGLTGGFATYAGLEVLWHHPFIIRDHFHNPAELHIYHVVLGVLLLLITAIAMLAAGYVASSAWRGPANVKSRADDR